MKPLVLDQMTCQSEQTRSNIPIDLSFFASESFQDI